MKAQKYILCKYCVINGKPKSYGRMGASPMLEEELIDHIEQKHDIPVQRDNETIKQCISRFKKQNKRAGTKDCHCPSCDNSGLFKI